MTTRNKYVLSAAANHLVAAYKQAIAEYREILAVEVGVSPDSPETFEALKAQAESGCVTVSLAHSDKAIYGRDGNATFRVFHDLGHLIYDKKFTTEDEVALANIQWLDIKNFIDPAMQGVCKVVYFADTVEQSLFCDRTGDFPVDQKAFVLEFLNKHFNK